MGIYQVGEVIRRAREAAGISQEMLSDGICSPETLSRIENGKNVPNRANFQALMERLGKCGEKYMPFIRGGEIDDLVEVKRLEMLIVNRRYEEAEEALDMFERQIDVDDNVNRQFVIRMRAIVKSELNKMNAKDERKILTQALRCTIPTYEEDQFPPGVLSRTEIKILCNIAVSYGEEGNLEKALCLLREVEHYFERTQVDLEERSCSELLLLSNLGQCLGRLGDTVAAKEIDERAIELCLSSGKRGILSNLLYNSAFEKELLSERKEETLEMMIQAYYVAEFGQNAKSMKHIENHIKKIYGDVCLY